MASRKKKKGSKDRLSVNANRDAYTSARDLTVINFLESAKKESNHQASAPAVVSQLPPRVTAFSGRAEELALLVETLGPSVDAVRSPITIISGLAGIGKTALAIQAAYAAQEQGLFPGGVLFIDLHGYDDEPIEPLYALDEMLRAMKVPDKQIPTDADARATLYRSLLAQIKDPLLIVADNASTESQIRLLMPGYGPHRVIVTSRHTLGAVEGRMLDLAGLNSANAVTLLDSALRIARSQDHRITDNPVAANRLAEICAGLPLALQIVAALLKSDPTYGVEQLASDLGAERSRVERLRYADGDVAESSVAAAFTMSYKKLSLSLQKIFVLLALNPGPDFSTQAAAILANAAEVEIRRAIGDLIKAHLLEPSATADGRWRMHDLLRLYARNIHPSDVGSNDIEDALIRLLEYYMHTASAAANGIHGRPTVSAGRIFLDRNEALDWFNEEKTSLVPAVGVAADLRRNDVAFGLSSALVEYLSWRRYVTEWIGVARLGLMAARRLHDRSKEVGALNNLGLGLGAARRFNEAAKEHRAAAELSRQLKNLHTEGMSLHNLGMALDDQRLFDQAVSAYERDLEICRELGDIPGEATTLNSMNESLIETGRVDDAIRASRRAAALFRSLGNENSEGMALCSMSAAFSMKGMTGKAITANQGALNILRKTGDTYNLALALLTRGRILYGAKRFEEVVEASSEARKIFHELGDRHAEGTALSNLAGGLLRSGRPEDAIQADQKALTIFRETGDLYNEGLAWNNLGLARYESGSIDDAIVAYNHAVRYFEQIDHNRAKNMVLANLKMAVDSRA